MVEEISEEETISYIILHQLQDFATQGDTVELGNFRFEVLATNKTGEKIERVEVRWHEKKEE